MDPISIVTKVLSFLLTPATNAIRTAAAKKITSEDLASKLARERLIGQLGQIQETLAKLQRQHLMASITHLKQAIVSMEGGQDASLSMREAHNNAVLSIHSVPDARERVLATKIACFYQIYLYLSGFTGKEIARVNCLDLLQQCITKEVLSVVKDVNEKNMMVIKREWKQQLYTEFYQLVAAISSVLHAGDLLKTIPIGQGNDKTNAWVFFIKAQISLEGHKRCVRSVVADGEHIISASDDKTIRIWNKETGECIRTLEGHTNYVMSIVVDGEHIISASLDKTIRIWNKKTGECIRTLEGHKDWVHSIVVDGEHIISASKDATIRIWNKETGECIRTLEGHTDEVRSVIVDGEHIISASHDKTIRSWNKETGQCIRILEGHNDCVLSVIVDGEHIISGSKDKAILIWNKQTGEFIRALLGHVGWVLSVAADGEHIISAASDWTIRIWNRETGKCVRTLDGHTDHVTSVVVDGEHIISASNDGSVRIWGCSSPFSGDLQLPGRNLVE